MRPALLHRAATSKDARAADPIRKPCSRCIAGKTLRCPAARRGPTSVSPVASCVAGRCRTRDALCLTRAVPHRALRPRLAPVLWLAKLRPPLLRCTATPNDAHAAHTCCKPFPPAVAPLVAIGVARRCRASGALSLPRAVPHRAIRVHRAPVLRRCRLHDCVVPRRPPMPTQRAQFANHVPDSLPANASLPGRPRHGHASFSPVASGVAGSAARATL